MTPAQKIIKYFALGLAFSIILGILTSIMFGLSVLSNVLGNDNTKLENLKEMNIDNSEVAILDVNIKYANLIIKKGETLKAETNNKYITTTNKGNKLILSEKKRGWFKSADESDLIIYIPEDLMFDAVSIDAGAGKINIENLSTKMLEFDFGAGKANIDNLKVSGRAEIDGGAGEITISNGIINNLDLDAGVGDFTLISELIGRNELDMGVGNLNITLLGNKENYRIKIEKGIGSAKIDNKEIKSDKVYGNGENSVNISGGVGNINIKFK